MPNATIRSVFISFKTEEKDHARRLKDALEKRGFDVWWHEHIQCGQDWHGDLDQAVSAAGCVVVLWSTRAMASRWVRHEASQAIARGVYAPARIEPMEVDAPFNRIQATDLMGWDGSENHPGLQHLLARIESLIPPPVPLTKRAVLALWRNRLAIAGFAVALGALGTLYEMRSSVTQQVEEMSALVKRQEGMARDIERSLHTIDSFEVDATLAVDTKPQALAGYMRRFEQRLKEINQDGNFNSPGVWVAMHDATGPIQLSIEPDSSLWPIDHLESEAYFLLRYVYLRLAFFLDPSPPDAGSICTPSDRMPDLLIRAGTADLAPSEFKLLWDLRERALEVELKDRPDPRYWTSNRRIISLPDLMAARLCVSIESGIFGKGAEPEPMHKLRAGLQLKFLRLRVSGRDFILRQEDLKPAGTDERGLRTYLAALREEPNP